MRMFQVSYPPKSSILLVSSSRWGNVNINWPFPQYFAVPGSMWRSVRWWKVAAISLESNSNNPSIFINDVWKRWLRAFPGSLCPLPMGRKNPIRTQCWIILYDSLVWAACSGTIYHSWTASGGWMSNHDDCTVTADWPLWTSVGYAGLWWPTTILNQNHHSQFAMIFNSINFNHNFHFMITV